MEKERVMKRILPAIALLAVVLTATSASAQFREDAVLLTFDAGTVIATSELTGNDVTGNGAGFTLEKVLSGGKFNIGFSLFWTWADEFAEIRTGTEDKITFTSVPFLFTGRFNFLNSRFAANIGLGIGLHSSSRKLFEGSSDEYTSTTTGMAFSLPVEAAYFLDPDLYVQFIYTPSWMDTSPLRDELAHTFALGIGFQWGADQVTSAK